MIVVLSAFSLFHLVVGLASLGLGMRLVADNERARWRSRLALLVAELLCWVYPIFALVCTSFAWRAFWQGQHNAIPLVIAPILWLIAMGILFAIVDFVEDGVLGNTRSP